jgi:uncharacterized damage-inducible protein DinB
MPEFTDLRPSVERALVELLAGRGAHADPLACIEDLSAGVASQRPDGHNRSVWELVLHMNFWMDYDLKRIDGNAPAYPEHAEESWPSTSNPLSASAWAETIQVFRNLLLRHDRLSKSSAVILDRAVAPLHAKQYEQASSVLAILMQTIAHNSYHVGQIVFARRALGVWPPRAGGDTW